MDALEIPAPRVTPWGGAQPSGEALLTREWLVTNGLGGFASGTVAGALTRRYHGLLVAALPAPRGRVVMWSHLSEALIFGPGDLISLGAEESVGGGLERSGTKYLREFRLEAGLPVWRYTLRDLVLEKRVLMLHGQNTVHLTYSVTGDGPRPRLQLRPAVDFRHYASAVGEMSPQPYTMRAARGRYELTGPVPTLPSLRFSLPAADAKFARDPQRITGVLYRVERERGYDYRGDLWSPGAFEIDLANQENVTLVGSTEDWSTIDEVTPAAALEAERERRAQLLEQAAPGAHRGVAAELVFAADQFIITPPGRAQGSPARTIIAGYHWFTDWGRDTMISFEGLTLTTGRTREAAEILRTFARYVRDGLIPNLFPDGENEGLYHTADASLWFFHAIARYLAATGDEATLELLLPTLRDIADHHLAGTKFNIHVDPVDGLLVQGAEGYQLTWMDAKMGAWVVTPRRGKAVEINALWHNALAHLADWLERSGEVEAARSYAAHAARARKSFNARFWCEKTGCLYDVVDGPGGPDPSIRPNQIFAISLDHPILAPERWKSVLAVVERALLTPVGLRSLAPEDPDYHPFYEGDLKARDGAYHQGTVWAWLIGPFVDAWLKLHPREQRTARGFLAAFPEHLHEAGVGSISEIFDATAPHRARGCIAQAWSVAEVLRCWVNTETRAL